MSRDLLFRLALVAAGAAALVAAAWAGLVRMGWVLGRPPAMALHGPLLVLGFLGVVIGMERAVGLGRRWPWIVPSLAALSVAAMLAGLRSELPASLSTLAAGGLVAAFAYAHRLQSEAHILVMAAGAVCWLAGGVAWVLGAAVPALVPAMAGFLGLTIAGERLELARMVGAGTGARAVLLVLAGVVVTGAAVAGFNLDMGSRTVGAGFLGVAGWLAWRDMARRTIRLGGITRYMAASLLVGYVWLAAAGAAWLVEGLRPGQLSYDAAVHAFFLGFVMSMIFAHAPVIVPALTGVGFPYHPRLWVPLGVLHGSLLLRVAGDLVGHPPARMWGGMLNVTALALFALVAMVNMLGSRAGTLGVAGRG